MSNTDTIIFTLVAIIFFLATFISHYYYREYVWTKSVDSWVPWLQSFSNTFWKRFVRFLHFFGWEILWGIVILFYCKFNRASSAFLIISSCKLIAFISALKMLWNDPAPYMAKENINALECDQNTFQTPSLEVALSAFAYSMIFYLAYDWIDVIRPKIKAKGTVFHDGKEEQAYEDDDQEYFLHEGSSYQQTKANDFSFWIWLTLVIFTTFLVSYAAMYLGINSFDQVFYALCIGYGMFCVTYFFAKDWAVHKHIIVAERMIPSSQITFFFIQNAVLIILLIIGGRVLYYFQTQDFTVNPKWKSEHFDECGVLPFPSFFDKEMWRIYTFLYLDFGITVGVVFDSLFLGGTRIDYNQLRKSEDRSPLVGAIFMFFITLVWILLTLWGLVALLEMIIHRWLFVLAIPYFICGFGLYTFLKYFFKLVGATRPQIHPVPEMSAVGEQKGD